MHLLYNEDQICADRVRPLFDNAARLLEECNMKQHEIAYAQALDALNECLCGASSYNKGGLNKTLFNPFFEMYDVMHCINQGKADDAWSSVCTMVSTYNPANYYGGSLDSICGEGNSYIVFDLVNKAARAMQPNTRVSTVGAIHVVLDELYIIAVESVSRQLKGITRYIIP